MPKGKITTSNEYVTAKLLETEELLTKELARNAALEKDVEAFQEDILKIGDHIKVELGYTKDNLRLAFYEDPERFQASDILAFSGSLDVSKWSSKFSLMVDIFKLRDKAEELVDELQKAEDMKKVL